MKYFFLRIAFLFLIAAFSSSHVFAQADTIWYNNQNLETKQIAERDHYKIAKFNEDKTAFVESVYKLNGQPVVTMSHSSANLNIKHGDFIFYNENGQMKNRVNFRCDTVIEVFVYSDGKQIEHLINKNHLPIPPSNDPVAKYTELGQMLSANSPKYTRLRYADGEQAISNFFAKNIVYPPLAKKNKIQGRVIVTFKINTTGVVTSIETFPIGDKLLKDEALRVAHLLPSKWIPAKDDKGNPTTDTYNIPVNFSL